MQTFWAPYREDPLLNSGGFLCPEIHWMAWAFSCLQLRKFYPDVELHTNQAGKEILIDTLKLPYTKVHLSLENDFMNNLHPKMWAYSKIHTYSIQKEPFLHVDGDVFIWEAFDEQLLKSPLIAQNIEDDLDIYHKSLQVINRYADYKPDWLTFSQDHPKAYNAGILGGSDLSFIKEYTDLAFQFYEGNKNCLDTLSTEDRNINTIVEQYWLYVLSEKRKEDVSFFTNQIVCKAEDFRSFVEIEKIPFESQYLHTLGFFKKSQYVNDFISFVLKVEYPECWNTVVSSIKQSSVTHINGQNHHVFYSSINSLALGKFEKTENEYENTKSLCLALGVDFESEVSKGFDNEIITEVYSYERSRKVFQQTNFEKRKTHCRSFPLYKEHFESLVKSDLLEQFLFISPYNLIVSCSYEIDKITISEIDSLVKSINPYLNYVVFFLSLGSLSENKLVVNQSTLVLIEKIKSKPYKLKTLLKEVRDDEPIDFFLEVLKIWYSLGLIYFSKSKKDFIPQEPSPIYVEHQNNLKTQIKSCYEWVLNHYNITGYKEKLISKFDKAKKNVSLHDVIKVLEKLNFETKGVKGDIDSLSQIPLPAIAIVKLRGYLSLYVVITKVSDTHITIFNTELKEEESYTKDYFATIWDGSMILMLPKE